MEQLKKKNFNPSDIYLYKRDINGNVIYWKGVIDITGNTVRIKSYYGQLSDTYWIDSAKSVSEPIQSTNIGKTNERKPKEQAVSMLVSMYKDKLKKGYKYYSFDIRNINRIDIIDNTVDKTNTGITDACQPMKFKPFELGKCVYPMIAQPKYNGVRCVSLKSVSTSLFDEYPIRFLSKELTEYTANHLNSAIYKAITSIESIIPNVVIDGELYIPNTPPTTIAGSARNPNNPKAKELQFVIYDLAVENIAQLDRIKITSDLLLNNNKFNILIHSNKNITPGVYLSPYKIVHSDEEAIEYLDICLANGYEGSVLRPFDKEYAFGHRPSFNRKLKRFIDAEFEVLDIVEYGTRGQKVGFGCKFICRNDMNNLSFEAVPKGDYEQRLEYIDNKHLYIGKKATIKFYERTINNLPFHGNVIGIRDYE